MVLAVFLAVLRFMRPIRVTQMRKSSEAAVSFVSLERRLTYELFRLQKVRV